MKIKKIRVRNVKAIVNQELNLNGATAIIMAGNNKGKTTLLTALKDRLLKMKATELVRAGETDGLYVMEFMDSTRIEWELSTKTKAGEKLTLISKDGTKTSVITEIIKWFNPGSFDIDRFLNESPAGQRKSLEKLLGLDFSVLDERYSKAVEERKDANRDVERIEVNYKGKSVDASLPATPEPVEELQKELLGVESHNEKYNLKVTEEERLIVRKKQLEIELANVTDSLILLDDWLTAVENQPKNADQVWSLQEKLKNTQDNNKQIEENNILRRSLDELVQLREIAHAKDLAVKDILKEKDDLIKQAKMPEGFSFSEDGVCYKGFQLDKQAQSSSALYIAALKLASIQVGNVRMLHFDASFLDKNSLKEVLEWSESQDLQCLIEKPDFEAGDIRYELIEDNWING